MNDHTHPQGHDHQEQDAPFSKPSHPLSGEQLKPLHYSSIHPKHIKPTSQGLNSVSIGEENKSLSSRFGQS
jgi:hypothetical protein